MIEQKLRTFEIVRQIGVLKEFPDGWKKELNLVAWNGNEPKYDIRDWNSTHEKMSRGVTFTKEEMTKFKELLDKELNSLDSKINEATVQEVGFDTDKNIEVAKER